MMENIGKNMRNILYIGIAVLILGMLPGCDDDTKDDARKSFSELIVGHWDTVGSYEKIDGEWVDILAPGDECWYKFRKDGTVSAFQRVGGNERTAEMKWTVDNATGDFRLIRDNGESFASKAVFENDDEFALHYTRNYDTSTDQPRLGEFKDVLRRVRE